MHILQKNQLEEFKQYLDSIGIPHRDGKGSYQVLQVLVPNDGWQCVYTKKDHFTVQDKLGPIVEDFYTHKKERLLTEHSKKIHKLHEIEKYLENGPQEIWNDKSLLADWIFLGLESRKL